MDDFAEFGDEGYTDEYMGRIGDAITQNVNVNYCCLCSKGGAVIGIFQPDRATMDKMGVPQDRQRLIPYVLCRCCNRRKDKTTRVENYIFRELAKGRTYSVYIPSDPDAVQADG